MSGFDLSNFLASFFDEARERLASINQALVTFETGGLSDEELVALRRDAHTIKGSALMLGVTDVGQTAHMFEDIMEQLIAHPEWRVPAMVQFLYDLHDALHERLKDPDSPDRIDLPPLKTQQEQLLDHVKNQPETPLVPAKETIADTPKITPVVRLETHHEHDEKTVEQKSSSDHSTSLDFSEDDSLPDLDQWLQSSDLSVDLPSSEAVIQEKKPVTFETAEEIASPSSKKNSGMIGADEAEAWKRQRKSSEYIATGELNGAQESLVAHQEKSLPTAAKSPIHQDTLPSEEAILPSSSRSSNIDNFRPDVEQMEMKVTAQRRSSGRFLRVDAERLESLSNQVIELSTQQTRGEDFGAQFTRLANEFTALQREWRYFSKSLNDLDEAKQEAMMTQLTNSFDIQSRKHRRFSDDIAFSKIRNDLMMRDLRDQVLSLMLRPLDNIFSTFPRSVRDVAIRLNKRVKLMIGGKTLEMDQGVTESLVEPLVHLLNNAVAHGIESPEERIAVGKPEEGQVSILAKQNGSEIHIEIIDDGRGLDTVKIKKAAVEKGVTTQVEADQMDSAEILEMIFRPGFTTRDTVDDTSGRGIGMNVVQDTVRRLTGSIRIHSEVGKGTRFILSLPVSIAVQFALIFRMGDMHFGMLTHMVEQAIPYNPTLIQKGSDGKEFIMYGHYQVPIVDMRHILSSGDQPPAKLTKKGNIIIAEHIEGFVGIVVDELVDDTEIVVRDLDPYIKRYNPQGLMGNTIASDGSVVMLLEPYGIKEMGRTSPDQPIQIHVEEDEKLNFTILLVDDSLIAREVEKSIFESIGFTVDTAIDGMNGLEKLQSKNYDMVVTDLEMPRLDGFGLVRRIRNQARYENLPLMVISTRESAEDRMRALEAGADTYMVKQHLKGDEILHTVKALVGMTAPLH